MNETPFAVKCGNCHEYHISAAAVRLCYFPPRTVTPPATVASKDLTVDRATERQLDYLRDLGADMGRAIHYTKSWASREIDRLKKEAKAKPVNHIETAPNRTTTKVPIEMLKKMENGYYASRPDSVSPHTFFRVSRPKPTRNAKYGGCLKVQTQHGDDYKLAIVIWPNDTVTVYNKSVEDDLLLTVVDPKGCAMEYARVIGKCMRCNCALTDKRSRWFGIGPECEKHWEWVIPEVEDTKGPFRYDWEG